MSEAKGPDNRIAIVGRAGRFPAARNVGEFWRLLDQGRVATTRLTDEALLAQGVSRAALADPNYVRAANILPDMESFDAPFFGFSPKEAAILDPQHRHFLETCWEALEDAGHVPDRFDGRIGVYAGSGMQAYMAFNLLSNRDLVDEIGLFLLRHTGNDKDFLPTRASYLLNLTGPSIAIQTACSTSLVAVHVAAGALLNMECDMALAGGVTIELPHSQGYRYAPGEILSPDGLCRAFDDESQGTVFGSGSAVVVLRRMEDALADGDDIKAVILATAVNNDGSGKASYLAPSVEGQAEAAGEAVALAGVPPESVTYIEAHGTGTPIGDPIELAAMSQVYHGPQGGIGIGSVKTNIGHLDTAAGGASLIKVVEALRHRRIPASLNFRKPNSRFDFAASPFRVVAAGEDWVPPAGSPRRAAVNSLGVGGTNAHVIVEEAPPRPATPEDGGWRLLPFSARDAEAIARTVPRWSAFLAEPDRPAMADIAHTLREGRRLFPARMAVAARTPEEAVAALSGAAPGLIRTGTAPETQPEVVFMFPGGGAQYPGAGAALLKAEPAFAAAVEACFAALPQDAPADLRATMFEATLADPEARHRMAQSSYAIPALFILEYAYAQLLASWGITPDAVLAHSVGEYAAAVTAGVLRLPDALRIVTLRGRVMDAAPAGAMTTVPADEATTRALIGEGLDIAALNAPGASVVSGTVDQIAALEDRLKGTPHEARRIQIDVAAHSRVLDGQLDRFRAGFDGIAFGAATVPMVSSLRGGWAEGDDLSSADYWVRHLRHTVRFADAVAAALDRPGRIVVEVGPGQTLSPLVRMASAPFAPAAVIPTAPKPTERDPEAGVALAAAGGLWANGVALDWSRLPGGTGGRRVSVPTYAFDRTRHWIAPGHATAAPAETGGEALSLTRRPDVADWFETETWAEEPPSGAEAALRGRWLVFAGEDATSGAVVAALAAVPGAEVHVATPGDAFAADPDLGRIRLRPGEAGDYAALLDRFGDRLPERVLSLWPLSGGAGRPFDDAFLLMQAIQRADAGAGRRVVFAVAGTAGLPDEAVTNPDGAALIGPVRVAPREIEGLTAALVDLPAAPDAATLGALLAETAGGDGADRVALRSGGRWIARRVALPTDPPAPALPARLRQNGVYLITGGTGGVGALIAEWLARRAGARIALVSRSGRADPATEERIRAAGGEVIVLAADVTDTAAMAVARGAVEARFGPVSGVIHAAGTIADAPLSAKSLADTQAVMAPKVDGGRVLDALFPPGTLDVFAVMSSSSVAIAPPGQTDYVAANAWLEALAASRADGLAIESGIWRDIGMAERSYGPGGDTGAGPHPLLGPMARGADGAVTFARRLDPAADWVLAEHVVGGAPVLPGSAYVEIARAAASAARPGAPVEIRALSLGAPMVFADGAARRMTVTLVPAGDGFECRVESTGLAGAPPEEHARAQLAFAPGTAVPSGLDRPGEGLAPAATSGRPPQDQFIAFGPRWRSTGEVRTAGDRTEGAFRLPADFATDLGQGFALHPALLDMAMTVGLHGLSAEDHAGLVYAPVSVGRIAVLSALGPEVTARARLVRRESRRLVSFDVAILDPAGSPCVVIEGLALRAIEGGALGQARGPANLTEAMLANGLRPADAPEILERIFAARTGKVIVSPVALDRIRLAMTRAAGPERAAVAQRTGGGTATPTEARLALIWSELLGVDDVGSGDDFFALGGHSLNAVRMFSRIRREFGVDLPLATLFEGPTLAALAARIAALSGEPAAAPAPAPVATPVTTPDAPPVARSIPLTEGQREIYAGLLIEPPLSKGHNLCFSLALDGPIDPALMGGALDAVVLRHDALRAGFDADGLTMQTDPAARVTLIHADLSDLSPEARADRRAAILHDVAEPAHDLTRPPLMRAALVTSGPDRHELLIGVHHIVCDGWSIATVVRDLSAHYTALAEGRPARLPPVTGVADLVAAEAAFAASPEAARHRDYWLAQYRETVPAMDLPTDHPRPPHRTTRANRVDQPLPADLEEALRATAARMGTNLQTFVLAAFETFLARLIGSEDVVIGLPSSGQLSHGLEAVVAHGVNFLPLRMRVAPDLGFDAFVAQVRAGLLAALDHQNYTYGTLMRDLNLPRDPSRMTLVPVVVNFDNLGELPALAFGAAEGRLDVLPTGNEHFELFVNVFDAPGRVRLSWNHNADLFEPATIAAHAAQFDRLLRGLARDPTVRIGNLGRLLATERPRPASGTHDDPGAAGVQVVTDVFRDVARRHPGRVALEYLGATMDYATLDARSDALAADLAGRGVGRGDLVGITSERSLDLVVAVLGTLKAGAGYVPFDTSLPAERLSFMARDTGIRVLIGRCDPVAAEGIAEIPFARLPRALPEGAAVPRPALTGEDICYVMFTSGTTGVPKGVVLPHRSVIRMLIDTDWLDMGPDTVTLHSSTFAFDTSIIDLFAALLHGGKVVIPKDGQLSIADLADAIATGGVNTLWLTSGLFHAIADLRPAVFASVAQVIVGGDIVSPGHVARVMETCPGVTVINGYGPTESNVTNAHRITWDDIRSGQSLPIGRAVPGTQIYILDEAGQPVPPGMMGELAIAGRGLARGYWNRPELTAEKFVTAAWDPGLRLYRSGDLAMDPGDGVLRFFGRIDTQVKVRGFRVELSEVEAAVEDHPAIRQACVVAAVPEGQTEKVLVAYVVPRGPAPSRRALAAHVKERLPAFARPSHYITLAELPLNPNGKVDRRALPPVIPDAEAAGAARPETPTEETLVKIWSDILGLKEVGVEADFFDLGGHSLLALKLFTRVRQDFDLDLPISTLFQNPTVRDLGQAIDAQRPGTAPAAAAPATAAVAPEDAEWDTSTVINAGPGTGRRPVFVVGGVGGNVNNLYHLGGLIGRSRPFIGFQTRGILGHRPHDRIEAMAAENIRYLRRHQPKGPYLIAGYSGGALTAFEMARQLVAAGDEVRHFFVLDTYAPGFAADFTPKVQLGLRSRLADELDLLRTLTPRDHLTRLGLIFRKRFVRGPVLAALKRINPSDYRIESTRKLWLAAASRYRGGSLDCDITLFRSEPANRRQKAVTEEAPLLGWDRVTPVARIGVVHVPGDHNTMLLDQGADIIAATIEARLAG